MGSNFVGPFRTQWALGLVRTLPPPPPPEENLGSSLNGSEEAARQWTSSPACCSANWTQKHGKPASIHRRRFEYPKEDGEIGPPATRDASRVC